MNPYLLDGLRFKAGDWRERAACADFGPDDATWFPDKGRGAASTARAICATCPVATQCLDTALSNHEHYGVWGNTSPDERTLIAKGITPKRATRAPINHGTEAGANAHYRRGEPRCEPCEAAQRAARAARKAERQQEAS